MAAVGSLGEHVEDDVVRRVLRLADFLNDDTAFALDLLVGHRRIGQNVRKNVDAHIKIFGKKPQIIGRFLAAGMRVHVAADILHLGGDVAGRTPFGALEGHMFQHVRDARFGVAFVARAGIHPDPDGEALRLRQACGWRP